MDYEGLYEAFMAGIETAMPGGGLITAGRGALGEAVASEFDYGSTTPPPGTATGTRTTTNMRPETRTTQSMHPEAAAILKQVTGQKPPEEQTNELELTEDLLREITSGRRVVGRNDKLKSRPGQRGFSRGGKGYQPPENPKIAVARINAGSERQKSNSAAFARIMASIAQNPDISPDNAAGLARTLLRGGQPLDEPEDTPDEIPEELGREDNSEVVSKLKSYGLSAAAIAALLVGGKYARGKFKKGGAGAVGGAAKTTGALPPGKVPKGIGYDPKIRGGNPTKFPATPETMNMGGRLGLPGPGDVTSPNIRIRGGNPEKFPDAPGSISLGNDRLGLPRPQGTPTPQTLRSASGAIHLGDEQLRNLVNEAVRTGKLPDSRYLAEILRNRNKYSDEADKLIEMLDLRRGFRSK